MGFMDLVPVWDLKAYHLPRIESPFIATSMARRGHCQDRKSVV